MPQRGLSHVLRDCKRTVRDCRLFAVQAYQWSRPGAKPRISPKRCDSITELAFLRSYLALEVFLEESFILYLMGSKPPKGKAPHRFAFPPSRTAAEEWVVPERRPYASWHADYVIERAERFFRSGAPFAAALRGSQTALEEAKTLRNAIAHESTKAQQKFENLARTKLGTLPPKLTIGGFLATPIPSSSPPMTYLDHYLDRIEVVASQIIRV